MAKSNVQSFTFELPTELIAQQPANPRDSARLLVYNRDDKSITNSFFHNLEQHLHPKTTLVLNNTKVENCRWLFDNGSTEVFVLEKLDNRRIVAMVRPGKKFKLGSRVELAPGISACVTAVNDDGHRTLELNINHDSPQLTVFEHVPLPPYIAQNDKLAEEYQTVFAKKLGSKAAPTAGLHFTNSLLEQLKQNHDISEIDLQVGLGTFAKLTPENFKSGKLHSEAYAVAASEAQSIARAAHVTAVGTTSLRTLESLADRQTLTGAVSGKTDIFITPGYEFRNTDSLITNFHLPETSLLLLVEAFVGSRTELEKIYRHAISQKYRFYSFGDAMLVL